MSVNENAGNLSFTVSLSAASGQSVTVNYATTQGTASAPADYTATSGSLTLNAGQTSSTATVPITEDTLDEPNETFTVNLTGATNAIIADGQGTGTIVDNDALEPFPQRRVPSTRTRAT